jgi:EAL domain-containing protein (putative c-di-GMP-specific phosphodiesterase class I)
MFTVAEAVETGAEAAMLTAMGIDCMQGYYFGAPTLLPPWHRADQRATA